MEYKLTESMWEVFLGKLSNQKAQGLKPNITAAADAVGMSRQAMYAAKRRKGNEVYSHQWDEIMKDVPLPSRVTLENGKTVIAKGTPVAPVGLNSEDQRAQKSILELKHDGIRAIRDAGLIEKLVRIVKVADPDHKTGKSDLFTVMRFFDVPLMPREAVKESTVTHKKGSSLGEMTDEQLAQKLLSVAEIAKKIVAETQAAKELETPVAT